MARPSGKLIFLTGAPLSRSLLWDDEFLSASLQEPFLESSKSLHYIPASTNAGPVWRFLLLEQNEIHAGLTSPITNHHPDDESDCDRDGALFLNASHVSQVSSSGSFTDPSQSALSSQCSVEQEEDVFQFYEESFAIHEELYSSDMMRHGSSTDTSCGESFDDTFNSVDVDHLPGDGKVNMVKTRFMASLPRDLNNLPNAAYLQSITPQTVTINLVVGIISILPPREITTRRGGRRTVHLVEMLVGDDTRAGFAINIWLDDLITNNPDDQDLKTIVTNLRPRDIILIRNAALNSFRGKVYGQSLRRKGMTTIDFLHRNMVDSMDTHGVYSAQELRDTSPSSEVSPLAKLKRVRQWVMDFVGTTAYVPPNQRLRVNDDDRSGGDLKPQTRDRKQQQYLIPLPMDTQ